LQHSDAGDGGVGNALQIGGLVPNKTFLRAAASLCHPISVAAMLLLLFNDHWLRVSTPSWWTGKLGDFAWLLFAPFAMAMLLALIVPPSPRQERIVKTLAFSLVGGIFAFAKTVPIVHAFVAHIAETLLRTPIGLRRDPTDLIALASLGAAWWLWDRHADESRAAIAPGLIALALATTLTLANGPIPDYGVTEFQLSDDTIIARSVLGAWKSADGGVTWESTPTQGTKYPSFFPTTRGNLRTAIITDTLNVNVFYRVVPTVSIERSDDGGKTWRVDFAITHLSEAARAYADRYQRYGFTPGPVGGIVDPRTGNAIFAMAHEGALVRKPSGEYVWVSVGYYQRIVFNDPLSILSSELLLALGLGLLILAMQVMRALPAQGWVKYLLPALAWLAWIADAVIFPPGRASGQYGVTITQMTALGTMAGIGVIALIILLIGRIRALKAVGRASLIALIAMPIYFAPYYLWALNVIPSYVAAQVIALVLSGVMLVVGLRMMRGNVPVVKGEKEKTV
jgi:hypothetical protein